MAYGLKGLRFIQISNVEGTPGTAEVATEILLGTISHKLTSKQYYYPDYDRGLLATHTAADFKVADLVDLTYEAPVNMRHICWMLCNSIMGNITPTQPDSTDEPLSYLWTIAPALTAGNTPDLTAGIDTFTIEWGDALQAYEAPYVFTRSLEISGAPNEPCMARWEMTGASVSEVSKTADLSVVATQYFPFSKTLFYIDTSYAGIGGTAKAGILGAFTWRLETQFSPRFVTDGSYTYTYLNEDKKHVELELTYYRGTFSEAEKDKYDTPSTTYLQIRLMGATEIDSGQANYPYVKLDGAFRYTDWPEMDDQDGSTVEKVKAESVYDSTGTAQFGTSVLTTLETYP